MGLFDKKDCAICGAKIGLLGNRKLEDGNCCKDCAKKLSPWFSDRRRSTIADIEKQLAYREANKADVAVFNVTRTLGMGTKVLLDEDAGKFIVTSAKKWQDENPDVIGFSQVTGCNVAVDEHKRELTQRDKDGKQVSYRPQRFAYDYDFTMIININSPWFDEIRFRLNISSVTIEPSFSSGSGILGAIGGVLDANHTDAKYRQYVAMGDEIKAALTEARQTVRDGVVAAKAPKVAQTCPQCGATTMPDANGRCEYCGGALAG